MALSEEQKKKIEEEEYRRKLREEEKDTHETKPKELKSRKWYQKTVWIVTFLILFFPIGLFLMWRYSSWSSLVKWIVSGVFVYIVFINAITGGKGINNNHTESTKNEAPKVATRENFKASVNFTGTQFVISNLDDLDCENAKMEINSGLLSGGYVLKGYVLEAGKTYTVGALQFTKDDGTRLNPYQIKPKTFSIYCSSIGSTNALGGAGWYGEFK